MQLSVWLNHNTKLGGRGYKKIGPSNLQASFNYHSNSLLGAFLQRCLVPGDLVCPPPGRNDIAQLAEICSTFGGRVAALKIRHLSTWRRYSTT